jgi:hypothetical protein
MRRTAGLLLAICLTPALMYAQAIAYDYSKLYEAASPAVVQITTEGGSASGFLVTPFGHIATNYHVVRNAHYLAVQFSGGRKVKAEVVAVNPRYDMAVLKVNQEVVEDIHPLMILPEEKESSVKVGIPVVAIGSPLNQKFLMTQGILSKVDDTTVLGDFVLQPGNSGGPLMNSNAEVVAINTFGEAKIGGAIRVAALRAFLTSPELVVESIGVEPPADQLQSVSSVRYPVDVLNHKIETEPLDFEAYQVKAGDFTVSAITPVLLAKVQLIMEKKHPGGSEEPYYEWQRSAENSLEYAVTFDIRPESGPTKASSRVKLIPPIFRFGKARETEMEFKGEFLDFKVFRDGELLEPITPGRQIVDGTPEKKGQRFVDQAYAGSYVYSPDAFLTGNEFRIQIIDARNPNQVHKEIVLLPDSKLIKQLRADFALQPDVLITKAP